MSEPIVEAFQASAGAILSAGDAVLAQPAVATSMALAALSAAAATTVALVPSHELPQATPTRLRGDWVKDDPLLYAIGQDHDRHVLSVVTPGGGE